MPIDDILNRLEEEERRFVGQELLAPVLGSSQVLVRIAGVVCRLQVKGRRNFVGWAILRSLSTSWAEFIRQASMQETAHYLALFPQVRMILLEGVAGKIQDWIAIPAQAGDQRFHIDGPVLLRLAEEGLERFDTIIARFDGHGLWYERRDPARDPSIAVYLRQQLRKQAENRLPPKPEALQKRGLSREERQAYGIICSAIEKATRNADEVRLSEALSHAGGILTSYIKREGVFVVRYSVDGIEHMSTIDKDNLTVVTAGICLSEQDQHFDFASLVGVLREAADEGKIVIVGEQGLDEEEYWHVHPHQNPNR